MFQYRGQDRIGHLFVRISSTGFLNKFLSFQCFFGYLVHHASFIMGYLLTTRRTSCPYNESHKIIRQVALNYFLDKDILKYKLILKRNDSYRQLLDRLDNNTATSKAFQLLSNKAGYKRVCISTCKSISTEIWINRIEQYSILCAVACSLA